MTEPFSKRHGFGPEDVAITILDDAPEEIRAAVLKIAEGDLGLGLDSSAAFCALSFENFRTG